MSPGKVNLARKFVIGLRIILLFVFCFIIFSVFTIRYILKIDDNREFCIFN